MKLKKFMSVTLSVAIAVSLLAGCKTEQDDTGTVTQEASNIKGTAADTSDNRTEAETTDTTDTTNVTNTTDTTDKHAETGQTPLFSDDFEDGDSTGWKVKNGKWSVETDGGTKVYKQSGTKGEAVVDAGELSWTDYSVEAKVKIYQSNASIIARLSDNSHYYMFKIGANKVQLYKRTGGNTQELIKEAAMTIDLNKTYTLKLELSGSNLTGYVDGEKKISVADSALISGKIGFRGYDASFGIDDVVVEALTPSDSRTDLQTEKGAADTSGKQAEASQTNTPDKQPETGKTSLFSDNFEDGDSTGWKVKNGIWSVETDDGTKVYKQSSTKGEAMVNAGDLSWTDYSVEAKVKVYQGNACIVARFSDNSHYYMFKIGANKVQLYKRTGGNTQELIKEAAMTIDLNKTYALKLELNGSSLTGYVNGEKKISVTDSALSSGKIGFRGYDASFCIDDLVVNSLTSK